VGRFLYDQSLSPTPGHYKVAYRYLVERDPNIERAIAHHLARFGCLDEESMAEFAAEEEIQIKSEVVGQLASQMRNQLGKAMKIIGASNQNVRSYSSALENTLVSLGDATQTEELVRHLSRITRSMIAKSQKVEARLEQMNDQIENLRSELDGARRDASIDPLTGLLNRRAFFVKLDSAIASADVNTSSLCLAFCDIDHFKRVNDAHGHQVGDRVLKFVADRLAEHCQGDMTLGRFGGEEFVILFEHTSIDTAHQLVDKMRLDVAARRLVDRIGGQGIGAITFSAGVAQFKLGSDANALIECADKALYRAKEFGRDRVEALASELA
jgi:diguanylate cyclase